MSELLTGLLTVSFLNTTVLSVGKVTFYFEQVVGAFLSTDKVKTFPSSAVGLFEGNSPPSSGDSPLAEINGCRMKRVLPSGLFPDWA
jgi:hypothetical protein